MTLLAPSAEDETLLALGHNLIAMGSERLQGFLARLEDDDLDLAERAVAIAAAAGWRASPSAMAHHLTRGRFRRYRYVDLLSRKFVDAVEGRSTRQLWNLPGRYGKSEGARWGVVWTMDRTAGRARFILVSYAYELAMENAVNIRDRLIAYQGQLRGQLREDRRRRDRFVTEAGGGVLAAGIDGSITGFGAGDGGGIVIDDPFKNWQQAHSAARRDYVENQFKGTIRNRLDDENAWIIVIHHRVHEDDLTARLVADTEQETGDAWERVSLPAIATGPDDPIGRAPGEPLEPERFSLEDCQRRARGMGTYLSAALEQQNPTAEEGNELLRAWFVLADAAELPRRPERCVTSWDLKLKNREAGDYVVGQCWWRVGSACWLMDQLRGHYDHATTANAIALLAVRHPEAQAHIVESAGSADEVLPELRKARDDYEVTEAMAARLAMTDAEAAAVQELRRAGMAHLQPEPPVGDKSVRARNFIAPTAEAGNVRMPADAPWVAELLAELAAFPDGTHDDQVDAMSQGLKHLVRRRRMSGATAADFSL